MPVIARAIGGVPEVAGDAALLLADADDESVAAELLALAAGDGELRAALRERGAARVAAYAPEQTAQTLRAVLESLASAPARDAAARARGPGPRRRRARARRGSS